MSQKQLPPAPHPDFPAVVGFWEPEQAHPWLWALYPATVALTMLASAWGWL